MRKLDPNDIPKILQLVSKIYTEERAATPAEMKEINTFFTVYMGKAIEDCQKKSATEWSPLTPKSELNFASKTVTVDPKDESGGTVEFIVASTRAAVFNANDIKQFESKTSEKMIEEFGSTDKNNWVVVFNRLLFGKDNKSKSAFYNGFFVCIRFSKEFFLNNKE